MTSTNRKIKYYLFFIMLALIMSGYLCTAVTSPAYALPKIYQDIINKKKKEEAEKKKQEEEQKKEDEKKDEKKEEGSTNKDENKQENNNNESDEPERGLYPIVHKPDLDPYISIYNLKLINSVGVSDSSFSLDDTVDLQVSYKIGDYDGFDDVHLSWTVKNGNGRAISHDSRTIRLKPDRYVTERITDAIPMYQLSDSSSFSVAVTIEVENKRARQTTSSKVKGIDGKIHIYDAYLTTQKSYDRSYPGYSPTTFYQGDSFWVVIRYEITGDIRGDIEFECEVDTYYDNTIYRDTFYSKAKRGNQTVTHHGWLPDYASSKTSRMTLRVKAIYGDSSSVASASYSLKPSSSTGGYGDYNNSDYWQSGSQRNYYINSLFSSSRPNDWLRKRFFSDSDSIYLIATHNTMYDVDEFVWLNWHVYNSLDELILTNEGRFRTSNDGFIPIELNLPYNLPSGRYSYRVSLKNKPYSSSRSGNFHIVRNPSAINLNNLGDIEETNVVMRETADKVISFEIDNHLTMNIPVDWDGMFHYDGDLPPFTFLPTSEITGMVLTSKFENVETTFADAIQYYEKLESNATGINGALEKVEMIIANLNHSIRLYKGKIEHQGEYLNTYIEDVDILVIHIWYPKDEIKILYSIRLVAPTAKSELSFDFAEDIVEMVDINI